ncbi:TPA: hypothetical protein ACH3X3_006923 [Trebouxia sp. C0006]
MGREVIAEDPSFGCNFSTGSSVLLKAPATLPSGSMECASRQLQSGCLPEAGPWKLCTVTCGRVLSPAGHHTSIPAGTAGVVLSESDKEEGELNEQIDEDSQGLEETFGSSEQSSPFEHN